MKYEDVQVGLNSLCVFLILNFHIEVTLRKINV